MSLALAATPGPSTWPAPAFRAARIDAPGRVLDLSEHLGRRPVVLHFWASWCAACRAEAPALREAEARLRGRVLFVGVDMQDSPGDARDFLQTYAWSFLNVRDPWGAVARRYRVGGVPTTVFIDAAGRVVRVHAGPLTAERLAAYVRALTQPPAP